MDLTLLSYSDFEPNLLETSFLEGENSDELIYDSFLFDDFTIPNTIDISSIDQKKPTLTVNYTQQPKLQQNHQNEAVKKPQQPQQHNVNLHLNLNLKLDSNQQTTVYNSNQQKTIYNTNPQNSISKSQKKTKLPQTKTKQNNEIHKLPKIGTIKEISIPIKKKRIKTTKVLKKTNKGVKQNSQPTKVKKKHGRALDDEALKIRQRLAAIEDPDIIKKLTPQEKRLRRLERNRISAKRTRTRKKNEEKDSGGQISQLQKIVQQLQNQLNKQKNEIHRLNSVIEHYKTKETQHQQQQQFQQSDQLFHRQKNILGLNNQTIFAIGKNKNNSDLENNIFGDQTEDSENFIPRKRTREIKKQPNFKLFKTNPKSLFTTLFAFWVIVGLCYNIGTNFKIDRSTQPHSLSRIEKESVGPIPWNQKKGNGNDESHDDNQEIFGNTENTNPSEQQHDDQQETQIVISLDLEVDSDSEIESDFDLDTDHQEQANSNKNIQKNNT
ncbi:basic-leucine zipper transcription factor f-related [Anaeramoeba flamelloides]|uniref:Basic-leucine zipper transcription factor f-related n=1 Tax=Anaeramoeba flamelloides TaxID=1746091 RepID=A0AAV7Y2P5_9EUKA|nr:basic-leucine zipper transcription factor f-related [Anaeramoeba flamelloides]